MNDKELLSVGEKLKQIRLQKGLSLEEAHKKTKIHIEKLKAIEEGEAISIDPVYLRGLLKIYCQFLEVEPSEVIPDYKEPRGKVELKSNFSEIQDNLPKFSPDISRLVLSFIRSKRFKKLAVFLGALLFILLVFNWGRAFLSKRKNLVMTAQVENSLDAQGARKVRSEKNSTPVTTNPVSSVPVAETKPKPASGVSSRSHTPTEPAIKLVIHAQQDCYIQVKSDGQTVFQGILKKGRFESWQAKEKIVFSLGNAGAVSLEVNGRPITNIGRRGQALKNIEITKEGLVVP